MDQFEELTIEELFEEELLALEEQHAKLIAENTLDSRTTAQKIANVIEYFKLRLNLLDYDLNDAYGVDGKETLH